MKVTIGSYKGQPTISLDAESKWPFTFGVKKAQLILAAIPQIQAFVSKYSPPANSSQPGPDRFDMAVEDNGARQCGLV